MSASSASANRVEAETIDRRILFYYGLPGLITAIPTVPVFTLLPVFYAGQMGVGLALSGLVLFLSRALDVVIQLDRLSDGSRRITAVTEVIGMEGNVVTTQDIFVFEQRTIDDEGRVRGTFRATGTRPRFADRLQRMGIDLPPDLFRFRMDV